VSRGGAAAGRVSVSRCDQRDVELSVLDGAEQPARSRAAGDADIGGRRKQLPRSLLEHLHLRRAAAGSTS
jgi:hypothetical protein